MLSTIAPFRPTRRPATTLILADLHAALVSQQRDLILDQLDLLRDSGDSTALASIGAYFWRKQVEYLDPEVLNEWNDSINILVQQVPIHGYFWLHSQRSSFYSTSMGDALSIISTFNTNGRIREEAVRNLDDSDPQVIAAQIVRLVDWVEPIRRFVELNLSALLEIDMSPDSTLVECLPLIVELERYTIVSPAIKACFRDYLHHNIAILRAGLNHHDLRIARAAAIIAAGLPAAQRHELLELGLRLRDQMVRLHWAEIGLADESTRQLVYARLSNERVPAIKVILLRALDQDQAENIHAELENGLFDAAGRVRQFCQFALRQRGIAAPDLYRAVLDQPSGAKTEQSLLGLAECGQQSDLDYGLFYLDSAVPRIRYAALRLAGRYATADHQAILWQLLDDPTPKVARIAARVLQTTGSIQLADWSRRYGKAGLPMQRLLLHIARRLPWEQRKPAFAQALSDPTIDEDLRAIIQQDYHFRMYVGL
jgi:hypothetical protein